VRAVLLATLLLTACDDVVETVSPAAPDQCLRREIFTECLRLVPKGPDTVVNNDWDEVIEACALTAYYQSLRRREFIKPGCE
jgi:hypothetical protein